MTAGRDEYDLTPFFSAPLHDVQAVEYRHQILRDMEDGALSRALAEFAGRMRDMRKHLGQSSKLRYRYQKESWFLDAARVYCQAVSALAERAHRDQPEFTRLHRVPGVPGGLHHVGRRSPAWPPTSRG